MHSLRTACFALAVSAGAALTATGASAADDHAADRKRCEGYGFKPNTDAFATCMMKNDEERKDQAKKDQTSDERMKALSIKRKGDERYPICTAAGMDNKLDTTNNVWYGPNCRQK